ncbi:MAG TPA: PTS system mannose/fructose/sorbose family transporter subunit IID [Gemmatimonadales bacterium]|nr:PTS system mannose/fructose/sorbose family transporter subunit IID [Gemmatimonadales bacterium]
MVARAEPVPGFRSALARLFTIQAAFTYERMLGVGFAFASEPLLRGLRRREGGGPAFGAALAREASYFNAHPYLAALAVGALARAENDGVAPERIERLRAALIGPLGSLGDRLIWAGWLPACAAVGLLLVALSAGGWAVLAFLVLYNLMHVSLRVWGLRVGWRAGVGVAGALASPALQRALEVVAPLAALVVGAALPAVLGWFPFRAHWEVFAAAAAALGFAELVRAMQGRATGLVVAAFALAVVVAVGMAW